jgi:hypothetical protein
MSENKKTLEDRLIRMVRSSPTLMELLSIVRDLELASWCIGAGAVRSMVWNQLHGFAAPSHYDDVDVAYFDEAAGEEQDGELSKQLRDLLPSVRWEVTNQALVHHWFLNKYSQVVPPLRSLADGIATWPEYATCVGVTLRADDSIEIIAPHGLEDLFHLRVRHNPIRASAAMFSERVKSKRFTERWPMLSVISSE